MTISLSKITALEAALEYLVKAETGEEQREYDPEGFHEGPRQGHYFKPGEREAGGKEVDVVQAPELPKSGIELERDRQRNQATELEALNLVSPQDITDGGYSNVIKRSDANDLVEPDFLNENGANDENLYERAIKLGLDRVTVWHGTTGKGATGILTDGAIHAAKTGGGFGAGFNMSPVAASHWSGGRQVGSEKKHSYDKLSVIIQFDIPVESLKDITLDQSSDSYTLKAMESTFSLNLDTTKILYNDDPDNPAPSAHFNLLGNKEFSGVPKNLLKKDYLAKSFASDSSIRIGNLDIPVELATDPIAGLSGRDSLIPGTGMLFHLDGHPVITMQGMKFPLDLVWMAGGRVVDLTENALVPVLDQETLYIPEAHATDVLEINGGEVQRLGIKIGDFVTDSNHILWKQAGEKIYNPSGAHQGPRGGRYDIAGEGGEDESAPEVATPEEAPQQDPFAEAQEGGDVDWTNEDTLKSVADIGGTFSPTGEFIDAPEEVKEQVGFVDEEDPQWEAWASFGNEHGAATDQGWGGEEPDYEVEDFDEEGNFVGTQVQSADKVKEYAQGEQATTGIPLISEIGEPIDEIYDFHGLGDEDPVTLEHIKSYVASQQPSNLSKLLVLEAALEHLFKMKSGEVPEYGDAPPNTPAYKGKRGGSFYYPSEVGTFTSVDDAAEEDIPIGEEIEREVVAAQDAGGMVPWKAYAEMLPSITKEEVSKQLQDGKREGWSGLRDTTPVTPGVVMRDDEGNITNISTPDGHMISVKEIDPKEPDRGGKSGLVIARTADAEVQAQWVDSQGHTQGTYSFEHDKTAKGKKAAQVAQLVEVLPKLEKALKRDMKDPKPLGKMRSATIREAAFTISLIHDTFRRVGGPGGATLITMDGQEGRPKKIGKDGKPVRERVKTYGITTMLGKHVKVAGNKVTLDFLGKRGIRNVVTVSDSSLSRELIRRKKEGGPNDTILNISEVAVNNYLKRVSGRDITAKNFRTYHGTRLGLEALEAVGETPSIKKSTFEVDMTKLVSKIQNKGGKDLTADEWRDAIELYVIDAHNRFKLNLIGEPVSKRLGNQPNVALKDYISETIFEQDWDPSFSTEMEKLLEIPRFSAKKIASVQAKIKEQVAKARRKKQK